MSANILRQCEQCGAEFFIFRAWLRKGRNAGKCCSRTCADKRKRSVTLKERFDKVPKTESQTGCIIWCGRRFRFGYGQLWYEGRIHGAHRIAWILANGPIPEGACVLHNCDVPQCVNPGHLRLGTVSDNSHDMVSRNRQASGERNGQSRLTDDQVREIRAAHAAGGRTYKSIGKQFGVSNVLISLIVRRKAWKHI